MLVLFKPRFLFLFLFELWPVRFLAYLPTNQTRDFHVHAISHCLSSYQLEHALPSTAYPNPNSVASVAAWVPAT